MTNQVAISQIPKEAYYVVGAVILANLSTIWSMYNSSVNSRVESAIQKERLSKLQEIVEKHDKDIDAAHEKIRNMQK